MAVRITVGPMRKTLRSNPYGNRSQAFNAYVRRVAPIIRDLQAGGVLGIRDLAAALNDVRVDSPSGRLWTYGTTRRALNRAKALRLGVRPRTLVEAAQTRRRSTTRVYRGRTRPWRLDAREQALMAEVAQQHLQLEERSRESRSRGGPGV
jgi:hypothetical protein